MNFYDLLKARAEVFRKKIFLRVDGRSFTYGEFLQAVDDSSADNGSADDSSVADSSTDNSLRGGKFVSQAANFFAAQKVNRTNFFSVATSGSTSAPKILSRTVESWTDFFPTQNEIFRVDASSKLFMHGDLNFTGNLNTLLAAVHAGATILTSNKFSPRRWLELLADATNIYLVPTKLTLLTTGAPMKNIRAIFTGSQVLTAAQSLALMEKFPAAEIFLYYGASELSFVTYKKISADNAADVQNLGKPFDGVKVFIRDGLIYVDTPFRACGIERPATVGDAGFLNGRGELIFIGRGEDFINRGGVKVCAATVENKISALGGVQGVAVVKVPDMTRGENFIAYVVGTADKKIIRQALEPAELPREIIFVKSLPLNAAGKVDKKFLVTHTQL